MKKGLFLALLFVVPALAFADGITYSGLGAGALSLSVTGPATVGSELVTNGTFTGGATGWTLGGGGGAPDWAYGTNNVSHASGGGTSALQPSTPITVVAGGVYFVSYALSSVTSGTVTASIGGTSGTAASLTGTVAISQILTATNTSNLLLTPTNDFAGIVDTISVVRLTNYSSPALTFATGDIWPFEFRVMSGLNKSLFIGTDAGKGYVTGTDNIGIGADALENLTSGTENVAIGTSSLALNTSGYRNVAIGRQALSSLLWSYANIGIGYRSGLAVTAGIDNVLVGADAGYSSGASPSTGNAVTTGGQLTFVGRRAGLASSTQYSNSGCFGANCFVGANNTYAIGDETAGVVVNVGSSSQGTVSSTGVLLAATLFANLGAPTNGTLLYCSDCAIANPCAGSGTGALAKRLAGAWVCN